MFAFLMSLMGKVAAFFTTLVGGTFQMSMDYLYACVTQLISWIVGFLWGLLPGGTSQLIGADGAYPQQVDAFLHDHLGIAAWFFPVGGMIATITGTYLVVGSIRVVRWALAVNPVPFLKVS